jgi:hypothetical protein
MLLPVLLLALLPARALGEVRMTSTISVASGVAAWAEEVELKASRMRDDGSLPATGYAECAATRELPDAFLCAHPQLEDMAYALFRASIHAEGTEGIPKGTLVRLDDPRYLAQIPRAASGFDLRKKHFEKFYDAVAEKCRREAAYCLSAAEAEFEREVIRPALARGSDFVVITFEMNAHDPEAGHRTRSDYLLTVAHEVMHAQYFLLKAFRDTIDGFWTSSVSRDDRDEVEETLDGFGYDVSDKLLVRNEFQAYLLQPMTPRRVFPELDVRYRDALGAALERAGAAPIQVR